MERRFSINELGRRLELALKPIEKPPSLDGVLAAVERNGKLRGPADWVFPAWRLYVDYVVEEIIGRFKPSAEEEEQLRDFGRKLDTLLGQAEGQARAKLEAVYKAVVDGTYRMEGGRLYAPDGAWMYIAKVAAPRIAIHGVSASAHFPDILKLPRERLELLQLGWRASDEGNNGGRPFMRTTQPWQVFAWTAARYGELYVYVDSVILTREGASVEVTIIAKSWRQRRSKAEATDLVANYLRRGEWAPLLTMWLGDGDAKRRDVLSSDYELVIATKEPWRLGSSKSTREALVATGKEAFERLGESAGAYGVLLDLLKAHKWIDVKLATDDGFRAAFKLKAKKRSIDVFREAFGQNGEIPTEQFSHAEDGQRRGAVVVADVVMHLELVGGRGGSLLAEYFTRDVGRALAAARRLESAGLKPNVVRSGPNYVVYIATADLLRLAERDGEIRRAIALYLAEKAKNGTPRQRELAEKILKRHPLFSLPTLTVSSKSASLRVSQ
ncbi:MAG: hypothetical protein RQ839_04215 [Thermoproteus sp.]|nr:hypothetical protein [Thermoproteus sp.]MDT7882010.1 hypothetical protein [Thermoproteus sp.]